MLWYYARARDVFEVEASFEKATEEYVLRFHVGRNKDQVERFKDEIAFRNRLDALQQDLATQQFQRVVGPPVPLKDGWKL